MVMMMMIVVAAAAAAVAWRTVTRDTRKTKETVVQDTDYME